jgi:hypothetical protein
MAAAPFPFIRAIDFLERFTAAELAALASNATAAHIAFKLAAPVVISATDPIVIGWMTQAVKAGLLTQARATRIMTFSEISP